MIVVSEEANTERVKRLKEKAEVLVCGKNRVDLNILMEKLASSGVKKLMLEGGSTLNYSMLIQGLVSELRICIAPMIAGGKKLKHWQMVMV